MRIAMLTYSVKPRGGVVHAVEVSEALQRRGHDVELFALAREGETLYRPTRVPLNVVRHVPIDAPFDERIVAMLQTYTEGLQLDGFDIVHAQDCLSANAALALRDAGEIDHVLRTVHHVDDFTSPSLIECQDRSILEPDHVVCVSQPWVERLRRDFNIDAGLVSNGVDPRRFRPPRDRAEREQARHLAGVDGYVVLTVGGVEPRKGSITLLEGFAKLRETVPDALLVIAGGTTLFDYRAELERFAERADQLGVTEHVWRLGALESEELERLFRAADVFAFPSVKEGFGLAALEAIAAGLPLVASDLDVFQGFREGALLTPVGDSEALAHALARVRHDRSLRARLRAGGRAAVEAHTWDASAARHERVYEHIEVARWR
jgi:glycosyltransferase-like protein